MNYKRIRPGAIVAISVGVLTALIVVFTSSGCQEALTAPGVGNAVQTREALDILPSDAGMVGMMNLAAARESNALDAATGGAGLGMMRSKGSAEFDRFVQITGFDPAKDLDRVYVAMPAGEAEHQGAFVAYGRFDRERLERFISEESSSTGETLEATEIGGIPAYLATDDDGRRGGIAIPNDRMILAGDEATLTAMVGRLNGAATAPSPGLQALLDRVAFPDGAWFVARDLQMTGSTGSDPMGAAAAAAESVVLSLDFKSDGVAVRTFILPKASSTPDQLADVIKGGVAAARAGAKDKPGALEMLDSVRVADNSVGVEVQAFMSSAMIADMRHESGATH